VKPLTSFLPLLLMIGLSSCTNQSSQPPSPPVPEPILPPLPSTSYIKPEYEYVATTQLPRLDESIIQRIIHVNPSHPHAVDTGEGSADRPLRTILSARKAVHASLSAGVPTKLRIEAGVYREDLRYLLNFKKTDPEPARKTLLVVEGAEKGAVIIKGSFEQDPVLGDFRPEAWKPVPGSPGLVMNDWPFETHVDAGPWINNYGFAKLPGVMQRSEMIWLDGKSVRQVLAERYKWVDPDGKRGVDDYGTGAGGDASNKPGRLEFLERVIRDPASELTDPGSFAVFTAEEVQDDLHGKIFLRLPKGITLNDIQAIEVGKWKGKAWTPMFNVTNKENFILRNLTVMHGAMGPMASAVNINNSRNFLIEDCEFSQNIATGLNFRKNESAILRRVQANENGANGFNFGESREILVEDCDTSFNNIRGAWAGWLGWHASAFKSGNVHNITVRRHVSVGNYANGIWYDVYCTHILVEDSFLYGNKRMGVMYELTRPNGGPHVLRNSVVAENDNTGVYITMASNSIVQDNVVIRNGGGGYVETDAKNTQLLYKFRDHPHGPTTAEEWERVDIERNLFLSDQPGARVIDYLDRKAEPLTQYDRVLTVLHSRDNQYGALDVNAFRLPEGGWTDFSGWRNLLTEKNTPVADDGSTWNLSGLDPDRRLEFTPASTSSISQRSLAMEVPLPAERIEEYWTRTDQGRYAPPYLYYETQHD